MQISRVSSQKSPTRHADAWQIGPFWQDILDIFFMSLDINSAQQGFIDSSMSETGSVPNQSKGRAHIGDV